MSLFTAHSAVILPLIASTLRVPVGSLSAAAESDEEQDTDQFYYYVGWRYRDGDSSSGVVVTSTTSHGLQSALVAEGMARNLQESSRNVISQEQNQRRDQLEANIRAAVLANGATAASIDQFGVNLRGSAFNITSVHVSTDGPESIKSSFFCPLVEEGADPHLELALRGGAAGRRECLRLGMVGRRGIFGRRRRRLRGVAPRLVDHHGCPAKLVIFDGGVLDLQRRLESLACEGLDIGGDRRERGRILHVLLRIG